VLFKNIFLSKAASIVFFTWFRNNLKG
jgi:hypothetical protein